jgi:hypothetical protein
MHGLRIVECGPKLLISSDPLYDVFYRYFDIILMRVAYLYNWLVVVADYAAVAFMARRRRRRLTPFLKRTTWEASQNIPQRYFVSGTGAI